MKIPLIAVFAFSASATAVFAQNPERTCFLYGPGYQLISETVGWSMAITSGQACIRGLRSAFSTLDDIKLLAPPQSGSVTLDGPGFIYKSEANFRGSDIFEILVSGKSNNVTGVSTIRVNVEVK
jgi:hypothetical protein